MKIHLLQSTQDGKEDEDLGGSEGRDFGGGEKIEDFKASCFAVGTLM